MTSHSFRAGEREVVLETGRVARQAGGALLLTCGRLVLLATVTADKARSRQSYMPLTTEFRLRHSAAGRIPGGYDRRETRPTEPETLTSRLIDRSIRPFFPGTWAHDTQVIVTPLSHEPGIDTAVLGISAASAALMLSDVPWGGPTVGVRIGRCGGSLVAFPSLPELESGDLDLIVTVSREGIVMVEGGAAEVPEEVVREAFTLALDAARPILEVLASLAALARPKRAVQAEAECGDWTSRVEALGRPAMEAALSVPEKQSRHAAVEAAIEELCERLAAESGSAPLPGDPRQVLSALEARIVREAVLEGRRIGGRGLAEVRAIESRVSWLPSCHGSALFTRGETQAIVTCTLGGGRDAQSIETLDGERRERFLLHYAFPPYSVGEVKPLRGPGRREIGHGHLARRALLPVLPSHDEAPFTVRLESLITESNGSSSMATVCGGSLALMDAGVTISRPVAGIAMGLVMEGGRHAVLSDILGDEDHVGDMDFKVCGTERGVTAIQLDNKLGAVPEAVMRETLEQAREGRLFILAEMAKTLAAPRPVAPAHVPRAATERIDPRRIGGLVGTGGKTIRAIEADLGVKVEVDPDGLVRLFSSDAESLARALARVKDLTGLPRLNEVVSGTVVGVQPFGSFVRLYEGIEGLLPDERLEVNQRVSVCCTGVNERGKLVLARA